MTQLPSNIAVIIPFPLLSSKLNLPQKFNDEDNQNLEDCKMEKYFSEELLNKVTLFELENSLKEFLDVASSLNDKQLNVEFPDGNWTAGQLIRHVIKVNSGFLRQLNGSVEETKRKYDENAEGIKTSFLNFEIKMKSPEFVLPEKMDYKKDDLIKSLKEINAGLIEAAKSLDVTKTCTTFEVPVLGYLTRYEIVYFVTYHTQRHIHQLNKIIKKNLDNNFSLDDINKG